MAKKTFGTLTAGGGGNGGGGRQGGDGGDGGTVKARMKKDSDWDVGDVNAGKGGSGGSAFGVHSHGRTDPSVFNHQRKGGNAGKGGGIDLQEED